MSEVTLDSQPLMAKVDYLSEAERIKGIEDVLGSERLNSSSFARCVAPLLVALDWFGAPRNLAFTLPLEPARFSFDDLKDLLRNQGFRLFKQDTKTNQDVVNFPVGSLFYDDTYCFVYLGKKGGVDYWHDGEGILQDWRPSAKMHVITVHHDAEFIPIETPQAGWFKRFMTSAHSEISGIVFVSLIINVLALAVSLFTMAVYNHVIPSGATYNLWILSAAVTIAVIGGYFLRIGRANVISQLASWVGANVGESGMRKSLSLSPELTARMGLNNNISKMRSLSGVRTFISGPNATAIIDYPFVIIFLLVIAILGGWIVIVPIVGLGLFALLTKLFASVLRDKTRAASRANNLLQEELTSASSRLRVLQGISGHDIWLKRLAEISTQASRANKKTAMTMALMQSLSHAIGMFTVLVTMGVGITLVLSGVMSMGGLIATMMLIWRITTPAQKFFMGSVSIRQARDAMTQLDRLMSSAGEASNPQLTSPVENIKASVTADRVFYRYSANSEPALNGISLDIEEGDLVAVIGPNGAGKTTLLNCLAGIASPQNGRVMASGRDIRQFDPSDYRAWVGYQTQVVQLLPITLREFLRLGHHRVNDKQICAVLAQVCGASWWKQLGEDSAEAALEMELVPSRDDPSSLRLKTILGLAQAILEDPKLLLLDDPINEQDPLLDKNLDAFLNSHWGKTTIIMATHRPDLIERADKVAILDQGNLVYFGPVNNEKENGNQVDLNKESAE